MALPDETVAWMRRNGVRRYRTAELELELGPPPPPPPAIRRPLTEEERKEAERTRKRAQYKLELGRTLPDAELDKLP